MKIWLSSELEGDTVFDGFLKAGNHVEEVIQKVLEDKSYDIRLDSLDCIAIIRNDINQEGVVFDEVIRYSPKKKDMDFRLKIDYDKFKNGSDKDREILIYTMLLRSLNILKEKKI